MNFLIKGLINTLKCFLQYNYIHGLGAFSGEERLRQMRLKETVNNTAHGSSQRTQFTFLDSALQWAELLASLATEVLAVIHMHEHTQVLHALCTQPD